MPRRRSEVSAETDKAAVATAAVERLVEHPNDKPPPDRESMAGLPKPKRAAGYEQIVERVFDLPDPDGTYVDLVDAIEIKEALTPAAVAAAANECERRALAAHQLYVCAKADHERYEAENDRVMGAMRSAATAELQAEREPQGSKAKSITEKDVEGKAAHMFADEWTDVVVRRSKARGMLDQLERLASLWRYRSANMTNIRGQGGG